MGKVRRALVQEDFENGTNNQQGTNDFELGSTTMSDINDNIGKAAANDGAAESHINLISIHDIDDMFDRQYTKMIENNDKEIHAIKERIGGIIKKALNCGGLEMIRDASALEGPAYDEVRKIFA